VSTDEEVVVGRNSSRCVISEKSLRGNGESEGQNSYRAQIDNNGIICVDQTDAESGLDNTGAAYGYMDDFDYLPHVEAPYLP
jgi:hypothetical protein